MCFVVAHEDFRDSRNKAAKWIRHSKNLTVLQMSMCLTELQAANGTSYVKNDTRTVKHCFGKNFILQLFYERNAYYV